MLLTRRVGKSHAGHKYLPGIDQHHMTKFVISERSEVSYSGSEVKVWLQWPYVLRPF